MASAAAQIRMNHVNKWLHAGHFSEVARSASGRVTYLANRFTLAAKPLYSMSTGIYSKHSQQLQTPDNVMSGSQVVHCSSLVRRDDFSEISTDPANLMKYLQEKGLIDEKGFIAEAPSDQSPVSIPESFGVVWDDIMRVFARVKNNYQELLMDLLIGAEKADNPIALFRALDKEFSGIPRGLVHDAWAANGGKLKQDLLRHIMLIERPVVAPDYAIVVMNQWFSDRNRSFYWKTPGADCAIYHHFDFSRVSGDRSGMEPHTDQASGADIHRTHHFKLADAFFPVIFKGLESVGNTIGKTLNARLPEGSSAKRWDYFLMGDFIAFVLQTAKFPDPKADA